MANKYIVHGATYCGNGTASNEAASAGAEGAWNDINVFEGTAPAQGTAPVAGDVIYIRSKTSAGADITRTLSADVSLGSSSATSVSPVTWVIDAGSIWSGVSGVLTYTRANTAYDPYIVAYNTVVAEAPGGFASISTATSGVSNGTYLVNMGPGSVLKNPLLDFSSHNTSDPAFAAAYMSNGCVLDSPIIKAGIMSKYNDPSGPLFSTSGRRGEVMVINPNIELKSATIIRSGLFYIDSTYSSTLNIIGGRLYGIGSELTGQSLLSHPGATAALSGAVRLIGFNFPRTMVVTPSPGGLSTGVNNSTTIEIVGCDGGVGGHIEKPWGWATSRTDNYPPTLNSSLPDSVSTPWAWRVYMNGAGAANPMRLVAAKLFSENAAIKTITQEILVANTLSPTKKNLWIDVEYTDAATGLPKHVSTRDYTGVALGSSAANWTATTWGMVNLNKKKLEVTTPTSIKQDSLITVTLWGTLASATTNDILFVDSDFGVN